MTRHLWLYRIPALLLPAAHSMPASWLPLVTQSVALSLILFPHFFCLVTQWPVPTLGGVISWSMLSNDSSSSSPTLCRVHTHPLTSQIFVSSKITTLHFRTLSSGTKQSALQVSTTVLQLPDNSQRRCFAHVINIFLLNLTHWVRCKMEFFNPSLDTTPLNWHTAFE